MTSISCSKLGIEDHHTISAGTEWHLCQLQAGMVMSSITMTSHSPPLGTELTRPHSRTNCMVLLLCSRVGPFLVFFLLTQVPVPDVSDSRLIPHRHTTTFTTLARPRRPVTRTWPLSQVLAKSYLTINISGLKRVHQMDMLGDNSL